ncbi:MAG: PIN domain-containing protein [Micrococcales bacterium]|nr:PIN domain-containing protein [Micrococcales bacterium]
MMVLDSSAILAFLLGEPGSQLVLEALEGGAVCSAANWSEVAQKILAAHRSWDAARLLLLSFDLMIVPVTAELAESAAAQWKPRDGRSLADRHCLAMAFDRGLPVLTADTVWGSSQTIRQIR